MPLFISKKAPIKSNFRSLGDFLKYEGFSALINDQIRVLGTDPP